MKKAVIIVIYFLAFWIILPVILIIGASYADEKLFSGMSLPESCKVAGFMVFIPGFFLMLISVFQFRFYSKEFPVSATPAGIIIQKGLFSVWRHPIYLFAMITVTGLALIIRSYGFIFIMVPVFIISVRTYIWQEEKGLLKRFGSGYAHYMLRVGLLVPQLRHWLKLAAFPLFRTWFGIRISGRCNIPASPPFFVVSGHRNYLDPFFISYYLPFPLKPVSTFEMFRKKMHRRIFSVLGAIPKKRYTSDTGSILALMRALDQGYPVAMFPEGERSWTGKTQSFKPETLRLFKRFNHIPILPVRIEGNYLSWPRWSPRMLRAKVLVSFEQVVWVDKDMDNEKLEKILTEKIQPRDLIEQSLCCKSTNITGNLSRVIYRCPACRTMDTLREIPPRNLRCEHCGQMIGIDHKFNLKYSINEKVISRNIDDLYQEIKVNTSDLVQSDKHTGEKPETLPVADQNLIYAAAGSFYTEQNDALVLVGQGIVYLTSLGIHFQDHYEVISLNFSQLGGVTIESYYKLQLYLPLVKQLYQVTLDKESVLKWQDTIVLIMKNSGLKKPLTR